MKTHWKKLTNPDYLGSYDFAQGEERIVTVKSISRKVVKGPDGKEEECTICHFVEPYKPMILNATNCKSITKLNGSPFIEEWTGQQFKIIVVKVKAFGDIHDALRIKSEKVVKPVLALGTPNFEACRKAYLADPTKLDSIKAKYDVTPEVENELRKA